MKTSPVRLISISFVGFAAACGDPIVGPEFLGTARLTLRGAVQQVAAEPVVAEDPSLSLFWIGFDSRNELRPVVEQRTEVDAGFAAFSMAVFDPPPHHALTFTDLAGVAGASQIGIALIVVYADNNENGTLNSNQPYAEGPDTVLGASASHLVVYASEPIAAETDAAALLGLLDPGYHLFATTVQSSCQFIYARSCAGEGALVEVFPEETDVTITLQAEAGAVVVPSPALPEGSGTNSGNIYGPR